MALSDREQQMLDQMERALASEDPKFASVFRGIPAMPHMAMPSAHMGFAALGVLAGLAALVAGVALSQPAIGILGFLVIVGALSAVLTAISSGPAKRPASPRATKARRSFMQGLEDRWDRRTDDQ